MNWTIFVIVAVISSLLMVIVQLRFKVYPAWKRVKIMRSLAVLAKCLARLNENALLNGVIADGHYLHDKFYKTIFGILTHKVYLQFSVLRRICHDENSEKELEKFHSELEALDDETRKIISDASYALGKLLLIRNPVIFILASIKSSYVRQSFLRSKELPPREGITTAAEYMTINAKEGDYRLVSSPA